MLRGLFSTGADLQKHLAKQHYPRTSLDLTNNQAKVPAVRTVLCVTEPALRVANIAVAQSI